MTRLAFFLNFCVEWLLWKRKTKIINIIELCLKRIVLTDG